ncbi:MAG: PAS domain S-box protein [Phycisphaeraceae bacterium]
MATSEQNNRHRPKDPTSPQEAEAILKSLIGTAPVTRDAARPDASADGASQHGGAPLPLEAPVETTGAWSQATFHSVLEGIADAMLIVRPDGRIMFANHQASHLLAFPQQELIGQPITSLLVQPREADQPCSLNDYLAELKGQPKVQNMELTGRRKHGQTFPAEAALSRVETEQGVYVTAVIRDISERKRVEARFRTLLEGIPAVTFMASLEGQANELYVSPQIESLLGFTQKEWLEDPVLWYTQLHPEDRERWHEEFAQTCATGAPFRSVYRFIARDGHIVWVHGEAQMVRDRDGQPQFIQGVAFDITERKKAEEVLRRSHEQLEASVRERTVQLSEANETLETEVAQRKQAQAKLTTALREKEVLLKEIHHRVKNNFQMISSMLNLQSGNIHDEKVIQVVKEIQSRIRSVSALHEKLYQSSDLAHISAPDYLRDLLAHLFRSYRPRTPWIDLQVDIENIQFDIDTAIPCGLIITELVSNSLKHAFLGTEGGVVRVALKRQDDGQCLLRITDDGVGVAAHLDFQNTRSLGLQIVNTLVRQLRGNIEMNSSAGTCFTIRFPLAK